MSLRKILFYPDPRLLKVAKAVETVDATIHLLIEDMFETLYHDGPDNVGLAANQIGEPHAIVVIDVSEDQSAPLCFVNPEIISQKGCVTMNEACMSLPGLFLPFERAESVVVRALDREGVAFELEADGLLARCIQHEMDHLQGKVFLDYLSPFKKERAIKKLDKAKRLMGAG